MKKVNLFTRQSIIALFMAFLIIAGCTKDDIPPIENEEEIITDIKLIFTNSVDPDDKVEARAQDPDGSGIEELQILDEIHLEKNKTYLLTFEIMNHLDSPGENIGEEISEEDQDHQIFFSFTNNAFADPQGDGNIDDPADPIHYNDFDDNGNPVGLLSTWTTSDADLSDGIFKVRLQHQPDIKNNLTGADDGDTDFELQFILNIQ